MTRYKYFLIYQVNIYKKVYWNYVGKKYKQVTISHPSQGDGIGRHARLKIWWLHGRVGSSPIPGKENSLKKDKGTILYFLFSKKF